MRPATYLLRCRVDQQIFVDRWGVAPGEWIGHRKPPSGLAPLAVPKRQPSAAPDFSPSSSPSPDRLTHVALEFWPGARHEVQPRWPAMCSMATAGRARGAPGPSPRTMMFPVMSPAAPALRAPRATRIALIVLEDHLRAVGGDPACPRGAPRRAWGQAPLSLAVGAGRARLRPVPDAATDAGCSDMMISLKGKNGGSRWRLPSFELALRVGDAGAPDGDHTVVNWFCSCQRWDLTLQNAAWRHRGFPSRRRLRNSHNRAGW